MEKEVKCDGSLSIKDGGMDAVRAIIESYGVKKYDEIYKLFKQVRIHNQQLWNLRHQINKIIKTIPED